MVLVVDALQDVGTSGGVDGRASSLDLTVRAAAAIGEHVLSRGDRVGLVVLGSRGVQRLASAAGRHQFRRLLEVLTTVSSSHRRGDVIPAPRELGADALVVMLSPLASPTALLRAVTLADRKFAGVIDCLPPDIVDSDPRLRRARLAASYSERARRNPASVSRSRLVGPQPDPCCSRSPRTGPEVAGERRAVGGWALRCRVRGPLVVLACTSFAGRATPPIVIIPR
jgi:uncharacterized protein (DUF58 family)